MPVMPDDEERLLLLNLGRTREGMALRQYLSKTLLRVPSLAADSRALHVEHGYRLLAADLLKAIEVPEDAHARSDDIVSSVHRPRKPVDIGARSRRRVPSVADADLAAADRSQSRRPRADRRLGGFFATGEDKA